MHNSRKIESYLDSEKKRHWEKQQILKDTCNVKLTVSMEINEYVYHSRGIPASFLAGWLNGPFTSTLYSISKSANGERKEVDQVSESGNPVELITWQSRKTFECRARGAIHFLTDVQEPV